MTKQQKTKESNYKINLDELQTGDILLFGNHKYLFSKMVEWWTQSKFSHIGIVLRDPTYINPELKGLYLWESGAEPYAESEDNQVKWGVQISKLEDKLAQHEDGYVYWRHLNKLVPDMEEKIKLIHQNVHGRPYDFNIIDFLAISNYMENIEIKPKAYKWFFWNWLRLNHRKVDTLFCSGLVGYIYTQLGLLPIDTQWSRCSPRDFSSTEDSKFKLTDGYLLSEDLLIYEDKNLI